MNLPNGGAGGPGRAFYGQALTTTTDNPLTYESVYALFNYTTFAFNRTDLKKSGLLDLWGGISSEVSDADTAYAHGNNLWLIRWDANSVDATLPYPADGKPTFQLFTSSVKPLECLTIKANTFPLGVTYLQNQMRPFEVTQTSKGIPLRGFVNYRDTALTEKEWSARLYGEQNYKKLLRLKTAFDPEELFTSNAQRIPVRN